jgi:ABC-type antimicrobial peptide transport system permease subunit
VFAIVGITTELRLTEIALRRALGATRWHIVHVVTSDLGKMIGLGFAAGVLMAMGLGSVSAHYFPGWNVNPSSVIGAGVALAITFAVGIYSPVAKAIAAEPSGRLRYH